MKDIWKKVSSIGLVVVLMATLLMSFPFVSAKPPGACEPWPECKDGGEEPPADPAIAFLQERRKADKIMVMNADGSNQASVYETTNSIGSLSFAPNGNAVAFSQHRNDLPPEYPDELWRVDVTVVDGVPQGSNARMLVSTVEAGFGCCLASPSWSPDGTEIAFTTNAQYHRALRVIPADGGVVQTVYTPPDGYAVRDPDWSSDGSRIAFSGGGPSKYVRIVERATGTVIDTLQYGQFSYVRHLSWARLGEETLAFAAPNPQGDTDGIYVLDIATDTATFVVNGGHCSWSPDNTKLVFKSYEKKGGVTTIDLGTEDTQKLADGTEPDWKRL